MKRVLAISTASLALVLFAACGERDKEDATIATSAPVDTTVDDTTPETDESTTTSTVVLVEGSFAALRETCNEVDGMTFDEIVKLLDPKPADEDLVTDSTSGLQAIFAGNDVLHYVVGVSAEDSCLREFYPYLPVAPPPSGIGSSGTGTGGGTGGGSGNGTGTGGTPVGNSCTTKQIWDPVQGKCVATTPVTVSNPSTSVPVTVVVPPSSDPGDGSAPSTSVITVYCPQWDANGNLIPACA